tara:strand:+ start:22583 stop:23020 length:438 start_codon:yes stop_codon:yes gene_type:complete
MVKGGLNMKYINPRWLIPETRKQIEVDCLNNDGTRQRSIIPRDERNSDYQSLLIQHSIEIIEKNTQESVRIWREEKARRDQEDREKDERAHNEALFLAKLEIFDMDEVKNSTNKDLKRQIRKSKNKTEVLINAIIGIINERNKTN